MELFAMIKINRKMEYALMILKLMSSPQECDELVTARAVCDKFNIPFDTVAKVMQQMNNYGILNSIKGVKGGYSMASDLKNISYFELAQLIEGKKLASDCSEIKCNLLSSCNISGPINNLNKHLSYFFKGLSIAELLQDQPQSPIDIIINNNNVNSNQESNFKNMSESTQNE